MTALRLYNRLADIGLIVGSSGNVSTRSRNGMTITPSGGAPGGVGRRDMARMALDGTRLNKATPSSEWDMHAAIYRTTPDAGCVIHTHADACTALACLNEDLPPFHYMVVQFGGANVRCAPYVTFGTSDLAAKALDALQDRDVFCLAPDYNVELASALDRFSFEPVASYLSLAKRLTKPVEQPARETASKRVPVG